MACTLEAPTSKSPAAIKELSSYKQVSCGLGTAYLFQLTCLLHFHGSGWGSTDVLVGLLTNIAPGILGWIAGWPWESLVIWL